jgi:predicted methyltransferase
MRVIRRLAMGLGPAPAAAGAGLGAPQASAVGPLTRERRVPMLRPSPPEPTMTHIAPLLAALALLAGCAADAPRPDPVVYSAALAAPERFAKDRERDAARKPDQVLAFFGIAPGMAVLDVMAGGGYMTEYASALVGPRGRITAYNPPAFVDYVKDELAARYTPGRLANVSQLVQPLPAFAVPAASFDAAIIIQNYHDVYWVDPKVWPKVDGLRLLAAIRAGLKPGGVLGVVDHSAVLGSGTSAAQALHRIEKAALIRDLVAAGFVLEAESGVLANPADDRSRNVFDPAVRGHTDQFVLRFRKPR